MKNLILTAVLLLIVSSLSFGQSAQVTAIVNMAISINTGTTLNLGIVQQGSTKTILSSNPGATAFIISGEPGAQILVTVAFPPTLTGPGPGITFTGQTPIHNTNNVQSTAVAPGVALTGGSTASDVSTGYLYIWMGGGITPPIGQASGSYSGTINVAVAYP
jgi:hypothetical protein